MASRGSVIPLFVNQILSGSDLTVTDPNMTRFMMSLDDAVNLVLFAFENGNSGDLFVNKAPAATIQDLANSIINLSSKSKVKFKLLVQDMVKTVWNVVYSWRNGKSWRYGWFFRIPDNRDLIIHHIFQKVKNINQIEDYNSHNTNRLDIDGVKELISKLQSLKKLLIKQDSIAKIGVTGQNGFLGYHLIQVKIKWKI